MTSRELLKQVKKLHRKKYREQENSFLIEGPNLLREALESDFTFLHLFVTPEFMESKASAFAKPFFQKNEFPIHEVSPGELKAISGTKAPQGVLAVVQKRKMGIEKYLPAKWQRVLLLDSLQEPGNLGTIIRAADWYGFDAVILSRGSVESTNGKVLRATAGSFFHVPIFENVFLQEVVSNLVTAGFQVFAAAGSGKLEHYKINFPQKTALIVGNERRGVRRDLLKTPVQTVRIPKNGRGESLNAAMAAAVLMDRVAFPGRKSIE